jgi:hypothetical protein
MVGRWLAYPTGSIKYEFIHSAADFDRGGRTRPRKKPMIDEILKKGSMSRAPLDGEELAPAAMSDSER